MLVIVIDFFIINMLHNSKIISTFAMYVNESADDFTH